MTPGVARVWMTQAVYDAACERKAGVCHGCGLIVEGPFEHPTKPVAVQPLAVDATDAAKAQETGGPRCTHPDCGAQAVCSIQQGKDEGWVVIGDADETAA